MNLSEDRQRELEPLSIRVYQQISAGYPMDQIRSQFDGVGIDPEEIAWVLDTGKQRYLGYQQFLRANDQGEGRFIILGGAALFLLVSVALLIFGWPSAGFRAGQAILGLVLGAGGFLYGVVVWLDAGPKDSRKDLD